MQIKIDYDALEECINELKLIKSNITDISEKFFNEINSLTTRGYWSGAAAEFYINKANGLHSVLDESSNQLNNYINFLTNMLANYQNIDSLVSKNEN